MISYEILHYQSNGTILHGYLAYDDAIATPRPGVVVAHMWRGRQPFVEAKARELAAMGYIALALDLYGEGRVPESSEEAGQLMHGLMNEPGRVQMRARANAAVDALRQHPLCSPNKVAAIGFCMGGCTVLEIARSGKDLQGVVSFHGALVNPAPEDAHNIRCKVLVLHGDQDPSIPFSAVSQFRQEMQAAVHVDWQLVIYSRAVHAFTNPAVGTDPNTGYAFNPVVNARAWQQMQNFLSEIFEGE